MKKRQKVACARNEYGGKFENDKFAFFRANMDKDGIKHHLLISSQM